MSAIRKSLNNFKNGAIWNILGQVINFFILLYLPRVLGPAGYGTFNFAQSYIMYFYLICDLGLSLLCVREVNQSKNKQNIIDKIYSLKFYVSLIAMAIFYISILFIKKSMTVKYMLLCIGFSIFFTGITIDYIFNALSNMKYNGLSVAFKNIIFGMLCFLFIKDAKHSYITALFYTISLFFAQLYLLIVFNKKYFKIKLVKCNKNDINIFKKSLPLAIANFMIQINNNFDIVYLTFTRTQKEVGYYSAPYKIINFLIGIMCLYFNAAYPMIAELIKKSRKELNNYITKFYTIGMTVFVPITFGGIALNKKIINFAFGYQYQKSEILFVLLLPLIIIRMITSTYGAVMIMGNKSKYFTKGVMIGAFINIILNIILTPKYGAEGSAVATILCESIQGIYLYYIFRKDCDSKLFKASFIPLLSSIIMYIILKMNNNINLFLGIILGVIIYFITSIILYFVFYYKKIKKILNQ